MVIMNLFCNLIIAAILIGSPVFAQGVQDHEAHHPKDSSVAQGQPTQPVQPQAQAGPGMMGPGMMGGNLTGHIASGGMAAMMSMMMRSGGGPEHIEGRLAYIKTELKISDAQTAQWNAFADVVRGNTQSMFEMRNAMMSGQEGSRSLPDRLALEEKMIAAHLAALKRTEEAVANLYAVLTDDQKKIADGIVVGPMGMPMGMM
jgi:hypothetical protein